MRHAKRCLLVGYNGAGNTGADFRTVQIIRDLEEAFGPDIAVSVACLKTGWEDTQSVNSRVKMLVANLYLVPIQIIWWILRHDTVILAEGSAFKDSWSSVLLWTYLWTAFVSICLRRDTVAYCVDVGALTGLSRRAVVWICNRCTLVIVRSGPARDRLLLWGVDCEVHVSADPVIRYKPRASAPQCAAGSLCEAGSATARLTRVGMAPIEFYQWPVRVQLFGPSMMLYRWPLYFSWDKARSARSAAAIRSFAAACRHILDEHNCNMSLIAMEPVDDRVCHAIIASLSPEHQGRITLLTRRTHSLHDLFNCLRSLDALVTARYHAAVIALTAAVPQIAVYHDERLEALYGELDMEAACAIPFDRTDLESAMIAKIDWCLANRAPLSDLIRGKFDSAMISRSATAVDILRGAPATG